MTEKTFDIKDHLVKSLDAPITTLFRVEDISSPVLREVAYSIRNECLKLYEAGLTEPTQDFKDIGVYCGQCSPEEEDEETPCDSGVHQSRVSLA